MSRAEFEELYEEETAALTKDARELLERFRIPLSTAIIQRSEEYGDESVFVVAKTPRGVLYFDDVEYGFNFSPVDEDGRLLKPRGNQWTLGDALEWFLRKSDNRRF